MDGEWLDSLSFYDVDTGLLRNHDSIPNSYWWLRTCSTDNSAGYLYLDEPQQYLQSEIDANGIISIRNAAGKVMCSIDLSNVDNTLNLDSLIGLVKSTSDAELPDIDKEAFIKVLNGGSYGSKR